MRRLQRHVQRLHALHHRGCTSVAVYTVAPPWQCHPSVHLSTLLCLTLPSYDAIYLAKSNFTLLFYTPMSNFTLQCQILPTVSPIYPAVLPSYV